MDFYEETKVKFADLSEDMLWEYIDSGEPMWVGTFKLFFDSTASLLVQHSSGTLWGIMTLYQNSSLLQSAYSSASSCAPTPT